MKTSTYTPKTTRIKIPLTNDQQDWQDFFEEFMLIEYFASFHVVIEYYRICTNSFLRGTVSVDTPLYRKIAAAMSVGEQNPVYAAAFHTGFFQEGIRLIAGVVVSNGDHSSTLVSAARRIFRENDNLNMVPEHVSNVLKAFLSVEDVPNEVFVASFDEIPVEEAWVKEEQKSLLMQDVFVNTSEVVPIETSINGPADEEVNWLNHWTTIFEGEMLADPYAPASILSGFLEKKVGQYCTIYCPLGYEPYKDLAFEMAESEFALEAAKRAGLLATGVDQFVNSALSNEDCWNVMAKGVEYLLNDSTLRSYIPFKERYLAEHLLRMNDAIKDGSIGWWDVYKSCNNKFGDELRGY